MELVFTGEFPPMIGGIGSFLYSRSQSPPADGIRVLAARIVETTDWDDNCGPDVKRFYYRHGSSILLRGQQLIWSYRALHHELEKNHYRLITASVVLPFGWIAARMKRKGHKVAVFCHGDDILRPNFQFYSRWAYQDAMEKIDLYVANSTITADNLLRQGCDASRIEVIHPPVDPLRFNPSVEGSTVREQWCRPSGEGPVILTVSRLDEIKKKGIDTVICVIPKLRLQFPNIRYVIVGAGPLRQEYETMVDSMGVNSHVIFAGSVSDEDLPSCYAACDVFILPSKALLDEGSYEGFGIVYREAMACGKPTIVSKEAGARDIVLDGENGLLVNPRDGDEIMRALVRVLEDRQEAKRMGDSAVEAALRAPDWSCLNELA